MRRQNHSLLWKLWFWRRRWRCWARLRGCDLQKHPKPQFRRPCHSASSLTTTDTHEAGEPVIEVAYEVHDAGTRGLRHAEVRRTFTTATHIPQMTCGEAEVFGGGGAGECGGTGGCIEIRHGSSSKNLDSSRNPV